jgi:hypothetical protein
MRKRGAEEKTREVKEKKTMKDEKTKEKSINKLPELLFYTILYEHTFRKTITSQKPSGCW